MKFIHGLAFILLIIGGLNWLVFALSGWDVSALLGGQMSAASKTVYVLVGLSALVMLFSHKKDCKMCGK